MPQDVSNLFASAADPRGVGALLAAAAQLWPKRLAISSHEERTLQATFAELDRGTRATALR